MPLNHLLSLSALHAAAPGVLDAVFGPDGEFKGAPPWAGPLTSLADPSRNGWLVWRGALHVSVATHDGHWSSEVERWREKWALDLRVRSIAQRLAALCCRAADPRRDIHKWRCAADLADRAARCEWLDDYAATLASLTLSLAPQIAALKGA